MQQLVGSDDQIDRTGAELLQGLLLHFRGAEAAQHVDGDGEAPETRHGGLIMLLGKHRGGNQNRHLLAVHDGLHHGPEGDLGFAEAHVAAEKTVHGNGGLHVVLDVRNAAQLVVGFRVGEVVLKFLLPGGVGGEGVAGLTLSGGVELNQLSRHVLGGLAGLGLCLLPGVGADFVQLDAAVFSAAANVFAHQIQLGGRDEQGVAALIGDFDIVLDRAVHPNLLHRHKPADAVILVNHQVAGGQVGEGIQLLTVGGAGFFRGLPLRLAPGNQLPLRQDGEFGQGILHAEGKISLRQKNLPGLGQGGQGDAQKGGQPLLVKQLL